MKTLLADVFAGRDVRVGEWVLYSGNATNGRPLLWARHDRSTLSPDFTPNLTGLKALLAYIDRNPSGAA